MKDAALEAHAFRQRRFECAIDRETGAYLSEDFTFCYRWCKTGGKVWLDTQSKLTHVGNYKFQGDFSA